MHAALSLQFPMSAFAFAFALVFLSKMLHFTASDIGIHPPFVQSMIPFGLGCWDVNLGMWAGEWR